MSTTTSPRRISARLPPLHGPQMQVVDCNARFRVLDCGRRWGKTMLGGALCLQTALQGGRAWWVAPTYKIAHVGWRVLLQLAAQIPGASVNRTDKRIEFPGGGSAEVRSASREGSLRGDSLDFLVLDECALIAETAWTEELRPTLTDRAGRALFISTPRGMNWFWRAFVRGENGEPGWASFRFPSSSNPFLPRGEIEAARREMPERAFRQEYLAEFLEDGGGVFRGVTAAVDAGRTGPGERREHCRYVLGVDLARLHDYTVLSVLEWVPARTERDGDGRRQIPAHTRQVYCERLQLTSWERQVERIVSVAERYGALVVMDSTGVGDPVYEATQRRYPNSRGYQIMASSKTPLIDGLALGLERGDLRLMDIPVQTAELQAYEYQLTAARNVRMSAPDGMHDDTVIALALAQWGLASAAPMGAAIASERRTAAARLRW